MRTRGQVIGMIHVITDENFEREVVDSPLPCIIGFTASWCNLCPKMIDVLDSLSEKYDGRVKFCSVNVDDQTRLRIMFAVASLPYTVYVENGMKTPLFDEMVTEGRLEERIDFVLDGGKCPTTTPLKKMR